MGETPVLAPFWFTVANAINKWRPCWSDCAFAHQCIRLLWLFLAVSCTSLSFNQLQLWKKYSVNQVLNDWSELESICHTWIDGAVGNGGYSVMSLKVKLHADRSSLLWGLSGETCRGGEMNPRYCLLDLVNFLSSLVKEMPFLLSSRAACEKKKIKSWKWFITGCLLAVKYGINMKPPNLFLSKPPF